MFPLELLPHRKHITGVSVSAADIDGDGLVEVALGMASFELPFDATQNQDEYEQEFLFFDRADHGAVLMFTLGYSKEMLPESNSTLALM